MHYLHNQWSILSKFINDPSLPIHNNFLERKIKHIATGRKSWLFSASTEGANATAAIFSILMTAEENDMNPYDYLISLVTTSPETPIENLLPIR
mgnify:CR=1 FL=1